VNDWQKRLEDLLARQAEAKADEAKAGVANDTEATLQRELSRWILGVRRILGVDYLD